MESTAQDIQKRVEAVLDEAIACRLLSACVRPWLLKWLMAAIADGETEARLKATTVVTCKGTNLAGLSDIPRDPGIVAVINDGIRHRESDCAELEAPPSLEDLIEDCIAHQDLPQAARLRSMILEAPGMGQRLFERFERMALLKRLNDGLRGSSTMITFPCREDAEEFSRESLVPMIDERIARREAEIDEAFQRAKETNA